MLIETQLPQRLDAGATPTFAAIKSGDSSYFMSYLEFLYVTGQIDL